MIPTLARRMAAASHSVAPSSCPNGFLANTPGDRRDNARMHDVASAPRRERPPSPPRGTRARAVRYRGSSGTADRRVGGGGPARPRGSVPRDHRTESGPRRRRGPPAPCPVSGGSGLPIEPARLGPGPDPAPDRRCRISLTLTHLRGSRASNRTENSPAHLVL